MYLVGSQMYSHGTDSIRVMNYYKKGKIVYAARRSKEYAGDMHIRTDIIPCSCAGWVPAQYPRAASVPVQAREH